ncbi:MAG: hypothetical protein NTZ60_11635 [Campylobacterales bacterium]|nr:hypothetical protein [Campylobacterales bacterium]
MAEALKNIYTHPYIANLAKKVRVHYTDFDEQNFRTDRNLGKK